MYTCCHPLLPPTKTILSIAPLSSSTCGASTSMGSAGSTVTFVPVCWINCWRLTCRSSFVSCSSSCSLSCQERENICWAAASKKQHFKTVCNWTTCSSSFQRENFCVCFMCFFFKFKCKWKHWKLFYSCNLESKSMLTTTSYLGLLVVYLYCFLND